MVLRYKFLIIPVFISILLLISCNAVAEQSSSETDGLSAEPINREVSIVETQNNIENDRIEQISDSIGKIGFTDAFPGLIFERPLEFQIIKGESKWVFIVEQSGKIFIIDTAAPSDDRLFLDITDRVDDSASEKGLLGLAFHPDFQENKQFYVNYTTKEETIISRFTTDIENGLDVDHQSEKVILKFEQPYSNHNGGKIAFGQDGYLYIATGDGGSAGDPQGNSQSLNTLLGKILRIDVDSNDIGLNYSIPSDNPFKDNDEGFREEIYAYGLRNPWRFSFDSKTGDLWAGDVGQDAIEEIDMIEKGKNYGWNIMEGSRCYDPPSDCDTEGLVFPVYEYEHSLGQSITGGHVYRGKEFPFLDGVYIYADFVSGTIWGFKDNKNYIIEESGLNISSFGVDDNQEIYFTAFDGKIYSFRME